MVDFTDLKYYDSTSSLGGAINTSDPIQTATSNNLFTGFSRSELIAGTTKYKCFYIKNESSEDMDNLKIWISKGTPLDYTFIHFGFDNVASPFDGTIGFDGTNDYIDCTDDATLWSKSLTKFSFAVWVYPTAGWDGSSPAGCRSPPRRAGSCSWSWRRSDVRSRSGSASRRTPSATARRRCCCPGRCRG